MADNDDQKVNDYNTGQNGNFWGEVGFRMFSNVGSETDFINIGTAFTLNQITQNHEIAQNPTIFVNSVTINETGYYECSYYVNLDNAGGNLGILNETSGSIIMCSEIDTGTGSGDPIMYKFVFKIDETSIIRLVVIPVGTNTLSITLGQTNQPPNVTIASLILKKLSNL